MLISLAQHQAVATLKKTHKQRFFALAVRITSMRKSKNRYFYHIFVSPGDSLVVITLNVILMTSELGTDGHRMPAPMHTHVAHAVSATAVYW